MISSAMNSLGFLPLARRGADSPEEARAGQSSRPKDASGGAREEQELLDPKFSRSVDDRAELLAGTLQSVGLVAPSSPDSDGEWDESHDDAGPAHRYAPARGLQKARHVQTPHAAASAALPPTLSPPTSSSSAASPKQHASSTMNFATSSRVQSSALQSAWQLGELREEPEPSRRHQRQLSAASSTASSGTASISHGVAPARPPLHDSPTQREQLPGGPALTSAALASGSFVRKDASPSRDLLSAAARGGAWTAPTSSTPTGSPKSSAQASTLLTRRQMAESRLAIPPRTTPQLTLKPPSPLAATSNGKARWRPSMAGFPAKKDTSRAQAAATVDPLGSSYRNKLREHLHKQWQPDGHRRQGDDDSSDDESDGRSEAGSHCEMAARWIDADLEAFMEHSSYFPASAESGRRHSTVSGRRHSAVSTLQEDASQRDVPLMRDLLSQKLVSNLRTSDSIGNLRALRELRRKRTSIASSDRRQSLGDEAPSWSPEVKRKFSQPTLPRMRAFLLTRKASAVSSAQSQAGTSSPGNPLDDWSDSFTSFVNSRMPARSSSPPIAWVTRDDDIYKPPVSVSSPQSPTETVIPGLSRSNGSTPQSPEELLSAVVSEMSWTRRDGSRAERSEASSGGETINWNPAFQFYPAESFKAASRSLSPVPPTPYPGPGPRTPNVEISYFPPQGDSANLIPMRDSSFRHAAKAHIPEAPLMVRTTVDSPPPSPSHPIPHIPNSGLVPKRIKGLMRRTVDKVAAGF